MSSTTVDQPNPTTAATQRASAPAVSTASLVAAMLNSAKGISDLILSPGRPPQVELNGRLTAVKIPEVTVLTPDHTAQIAADLIGDNRQAVQSLKEQGSCDLSYGLPGHARFRVNVFQQRGSYAIVMRVIPFKAPELSELNLPAELEKVPELKNGIVLVTGPTGSGKSSTLAAIINQINAEKAEHILTIEDPIEFLHAHKKATVHQRELHSDTPSFALALRAALRQAPKVILVGEMRDKETIEIALTAAETGHLVLSTLHTIDASRTVERIIGVFPLGDQHIIRKRLAASFRYFIAQRLLPRKDGKGRLAVLEILKSTMRTRDYVEKGEAEGKTLLDAMRDGGVEGMQDFDGTMEKLVRSGAIALETAFAYASNAGNLRLQLADLSPDVEPEKAQAPSPAGKKEEELEIER